MIGKPVGKHSPDLVVDVDRHVQETWSVFRKHADPEFQGRLYDRALLPNGSTRITIDGRPMPFSAAMWDDPYANQMFEDERFAPNLSLSQGLDSAGYLQTMDEEGIDVAIVAPTLALGNYSIPDGQVGSALSRAYGRWAVDFCSVAPERLRPVYPVNLYDVQQATKDAKWAIERLGFVGILLIALPVGDRSLHHADFDSFWAVVQDLDVPVMIHTLSSLPDAEGRGPLVDLVAGVNRFGGNMFLHHLVSHRIEQHLAIASLVVGGVMERFPNLRFVFAEAGGGWVQSWIEAMDSHYHSAQMRRAVPWLAMEPSAYVRRQCLVAFQPDEAFDGAVGRMLDVTSVCWASDYPHYDAQFPGAVEQLFQGMRNLSIENRIAVAGTNAVRTFRLSH